MKNEREDIVKDGPVGMGKAVYTGVRFLENGGRFYSDGSQMN